MFIFIYNKIHYHLEIQKVFINNIIKVITRQIRKNYFFEDYFFDHKIIKLF